MSLVIVFLIIEIDMKHKTLKTHSNRAKLENEILEN